MDRLRFDPQWSRKLSFYLNFRPEVVASAIQILTSIFLTWLVCAPFLAKAGSSFRLYSHVTGGVRIRAWGAWAGAQRRPRDPMKKPRALKVNRNCRGPGTAIPYIAFVERYLITRLPFFWPRLRRSSSKKPGPGPPLRFSPGFYVLTPSALKTTRVHPLIRQPRHA